LIDDDDYGFVSSLKWHVQKQPGDIYYAIAYDNGEIVRMHRVLTDAEDGQLVDHIDGNGLNNQKSNLRTCSHAENMKNRRSSKNGTSRYVGVSWDSNAKKWRADIGHNRKTY